MVMIRLLNYGRYPELDFMRFPTVVEGNIWLENKKCVIVHRSQFGLNYKNERNYYVFTMGDECEVINE